MIVWDADDLGANHVISDQCQAHDCRDKLDQFHYANHEFKATLFAIPDEMTPELLRWCKANSQWVELAVHGISHHSNYECEKMTYEEFDGHMQRLRPTLDEYFSNGFKAPGWQISDDIYRWLLDNNWWVADQGYNDHRRPVELPAYVNYNGRFEVKKQGTENPIGLKGLHYHTWDCVGNGVYELSDQILTDIAGEQEFKFVSELLND